MARVDMSDPDIETLLEEIEAAFGDLSIPAEGDVVYDNSGYHLECNQVREKFRGRHWRDLTTEFLNEDPQALFFFSPVGFRFFVPAFVRASIQDYENADTLPDVVVHSLTKPDDPGLVSWHRARLQALSARQRQALEKSLSFLLKEHGEDFFMPGAVESALEALRK